MNDKEMNTSDNKEPRYVISIAARMCGIETYTLRYYERIGLIQPYRSKGKIRYYSENDIELLKHLKTLVNDLGVNPAGAEVVIRMARMMSEMQAKIESLSQEVENLREEQSISGNIQEREQ
jgi:MerR family transcriptional regulator/heat shock protein HspR